MPLPSQVARKFVVPRAARLIQRGESLVNNQNVHRIKMRRC